MNYLESYKKQLEKLEVFKKGMLDEVVFFFDVLYKKPLKIGDVVFYTCCDSVGNKVPAYRYDTESEFKPMYDRFETMAFGWSEFSDVCKLCDKIKEVMGKELNLKL